MKTTLQNIIRKAIALLAIGSVVAGAFGGTSAGIGFILGGLLMLGSFGAGYWMTSPDADGNYSQPRILALTTLKFPIVGFLGWVLLTRFPPAAVVVGGMTLVVAMSLDAWLSRVLTTPSAAFSPAAISSTAISSAATPTGDV